MTNTYTYPDRLLPKPHFLPLDVDALPEIQQLYLVRHLDSKDIFQKISEGSEPLQNIDDTKIQFRSDHLKDLSTNLLSVFLLEDVCWKILGGGTSAWQEGTEVTPPIYPEDFDYTNERGFFLIKIEDIHNKEIPQDNDNITIKFKVLHTPTICNFWHFSIRLFDNEGEITERFVGKKLQKLQKIAKKQLIEIIQCVNPPKVLNFSKYSIPQSTSGF